MKTVDAIELRNNTQALLHRVKAGEKIIITQNSIPLARLIPEEPTIVGEMNLAGAQATKGNRMSGSQ